MSLVLWSGGLDSTLILHNLAKEHRDGVKHHPHGVRALTIDCSQVSYHLPTVKASRKALKEVFRKAGFTVGYEEVMHHTASRSWRPHGGGFAQRWHSAQRFGGIPNPAQRFGSERIPKAGCVDE